MGLLNAKIIANILGMLAIINGAFMLLCLPFSFYYAEGGKYALLFSGMAVSFIGGTVWLLTRNCKKSIRKREGYLIVAAGWLVLTLTGSIPYLTSGVITSIPSAIFETMSGYTTTGSTVLVDIESVPKGILFWRSLTHWMGGMGIIVLTIAILPLLGIGGMQLFVAEAPGPSADKLHPRITETAKRLWLIYVGITVLETILLRIGGMTTFDAINHAMSTVSTGGFSTKNASIAHYDSPFIQYTIIFFMLLAGVNFTLTYFFLKGKLDKVWKNEEFRVYISIALIAVVAITTAVYLNTDNAFELSFREALFQGVAILTTTGFVTADYTHWGTFAMLIIWALMFTGGSAGSTAGGVKIVRHLIILKHSLLEFKKQIHPSAILPVRFNNRPVSDQIVYNINSFLLLYLFLFLAGAVLLSLFGLDFMTCIGASISSLGNIGPGWGNVGPVDNFASIPWGAKLILAFMMLLGRLEMFTVLILFTRAYWKRV